MTTTVTIQTTPQHGAIIHHQQLVGSERQDGKMWTEAHWETRLSETVPANEKRIVHVWADRRVIIEEVLSDTSD